PGGVPGLALERLGLSDTQKDQVKGIMQAHRDELKGIADRERTARTALDDAVSADVMDEGTIRARAADVSTVEADMAVLQARMKSEIFQILTPDQQTQAKQFQAQMKQRRQGRGKPAQQ